MPGYAHRTAQASLEEVDLKRCALLVIDELGDAETSPVAARILEPTLNTARICDAAREVGVPVIFANDAHIKGLDRELDLWGDHNLAGAPESQTSPQLKLREGDFVIEKRRYSAFFQTSLRLLLDEFEEAMEELREDNRERGMAVPQREVSIATGKLAFPYISEMSQRVMQEYPRISVHVHEIRNDFFGEKITVSGLITGQDLIAQLKGKRLGERLLLPINMLRAGEDVFLDDVTVPELEKTLQVKTDIVKSSGYDFVNAVLGKDRIDE